MIWVPVLIVGGGPVGLTLATDLGWRGIRCLLVERRDGSITLPKMNMISARTMEFCRRWGIARRYGVSASPLFSPATFSSSPARTATNSRGSNIRAAPMRGPCTPPKYCSAARRFISSAAAAHGQWLQRGHAALSHRTGWLRSGRGRRHGAIARPRDGRDHDRPRRLSHRLRWCRELSCASAWA